MEGISEPSVCWYSGVVFARLKTPSRMPALLLCTSASLHMQPPMHRLSGTLLQHEGICSYRHLPGITWQL